ncbi:pyrimidine 5'-nucleotidase [Halocynthiibacter namhaensis]|mgnify:CR=1 FL=1|uniref:pyrimidine 5'-nucleotidase n=1 Tax=Halocynthiibacter namhaensis TaxID=1290553 RepID=UPI00057916C1|nr:pyrimidine 5'-nucleotidase [Halocynthiibacter namhaensis]
MPQNTCPRDDFHHVTQWVFDLDNTLYPPEMALFDQIEVRMTAWVMDALKVGKAEADHLRQHYWAKYGTTLAGLMREHNIDPDPYLHAVHDISFDHLQVDHDLIRHINTLPGKRIVYTNGSEPYARNVLAARGLEGCFDAVYGVEHADFNPKPERQAFDMVFAKAGIDGAKAAMFEDDARNLAAPHDLGMRCVHVAPQRETGDHIHHHTTDLTAFLSQLTA